MFNVFFKDPPQDVALKFFTNKDLRVLSSKDLCQVYVDVRSEFNKLVSIGHPHIIKCIGFCVMSLSFVLELAPLGSLRNVIENHKSIGYYVCPNALIDTLKQVENNTLKLHSIPFSLAAYLCITTVIF